jgi:hypothetical protein
LNSKWENDFSVIDGSTYDKGELVPSRAIIGRLPVFPLKFDGKRNL